MNVGQTADAMPSGMPTIVERMIATAMRASVVIALGHIWEMPPAPPFGICSTPNEATINAEKSAVRHEPTSHATSVATSSTPSQVIQCSRWTTSFVAEFRKLPKPPTIVCRKKFEVSWFVTQKSRRSNQLGTPRTQPAGKPAWKPVAIAAADAEGHGGADGQSPAAETAQSLVDPPGRGRKPSGRGCGGVQLIGRRRRGRH